MGGGFSIRTVIHLSFTQYKVQGFRQHRFPVFPRRQGWIVAPPVPTFSLLFLSSVLGRVLGRKTDQWISCSERALQEAVPTL